MSAAVICDLFLCDDRVTLTPGDTPQGQRAAFPQLPCQIAATVDDEQLEEAAAAANLGNLRRATRCVALAETAAAEALEARAHRHAKDRWRTLFACGTGPFVAR